MSYPAEVSAAPTVGSTRPSLSAAASSARLTTSPAASVTPNGTPALTIANARRIRIRIHVVENDVFYIKPGLSADLEVHGLKGKIFKGSFGKSRPKASKKATKPTKEAGTS